MEVGQEAPEVKARKIHDEKLRDQMFKEFEALNERFPEDRATVNDVAKITGELHPSQALERRYY